MMPRPPLPEITLRSATAEPPMRLAGALERMMTPAAEELLPDDWKVAAALVPMKSPATTLLRAPVPTIRTATRRLYRARPRIALPADVTTKASTPFTPVPSTWMRSAALLARAAELGDDPGCV